MNGALKCDGVVLITTTNDQQIAKNIAKLVVESKLAACAQIDKIESHYMYDGKYNAHAEYRIMIKTLQQALIKLEKLILQHHNYQTPQIISLAINSWSEAYAKFVSDSVKLQLQ